MAVIWSLASTKQLLLDDDQHSSLSLVIKHIYPRYVSI